MPRSHYEERFHYYYIIRNASPNAKDFRSYSFNKEKGNKRETYFETIKLCNKQLYDVEYKNQKHNMFPTRNLPLNWLIWYDNFNKKFRNPDYAYGYNIQTAKYLRDPTKFEQEGLIKFARRNNMNLVIPTEPTTLHEVYSKYTRYPHKIGKSTTVPYNNIMVHKNFDRDIYYIGGGTKFTYWNVFPNEEKCSKYMY